ncbi:MAG: ATP-binding cassette domain-containing protein [Rhodobacteraceae bacterium]|nr:ATP-binding cassette domain-containing protein [Paracoccaceae bacterium]
MARAPLLQLSGIGLGFGGDPLFADLDLVVQPGDRLALVGRNGSGKSTLMKVMAGLIAPDEGSRVATPGTHIGYMDQHPDMAGFETLGDFALSALEPSDAYRVEMAAEGLDFDPATPVATASGGERRRAALAKLLAEAPELMLLDEPTNHLDIRAIGWLEEQLAATSSAFVIISHDRAVLRNVARATLWVDRGQVRRQEKGFDAFEGWRDKTWEEEDLARHKLKRLIKAEARWAVEGISARRKRNQGRVRALQGLRAEQAAQINRQGAAAMDLSVGKKSGKKVIEAVGIAKSFGDQEIVRDFSIKIARGDRIAFVGPNGVGKTTLLKMLTGEIAPDAGTVTQGANIQMAVFDQNRSALDPEMTLWDSLTGDPDMRVSGRSDQVMVRGAPRHVVGYLKDFLFDESRARAKVRSLSGGERARLLLARIMARESNLLVLDEPTNDLDIETLDLLQELIGDFPGTVLLVSHDRDFLDRVATLTVAMEGDGRATIYAGGWSDYHAQRGATDTEKPVKSEAKAAKQMQGAKAPQQPAEKLSFTEKHHLEALPAEMDRLSGEIEKLTKLLSDPDLFTREPAKFEKASAALVARQAALAQAEDDWLRLEEKAGTP